MRRFFLPITLLWKEEFAGNALQAVGSSATEDLCIRKTKRERLGMNQGSGMEWIEKRYVRTNKNEGKQKYKGIDENILLKISALQRKLLNLHPKQIY